MTPSKAKEICVAFATHYSQQTRTNPPQEFDAWIKLPEAAALLSGWKEDVTGLFKITFTDCWEMDNRIDSDQRWMAVNDRLKIVVTAPTKEQTFEEAMISIKVMAAYESGFDISKSKSILKVIK